MKKKCIYFLLIFISMLFFIFWYLSDEWTEFTHLDLEMDYLRDQVEIYQDPVDVGTVVGHVDTGELCRLSKNIYAAKAYFFYKVECKNGVSGYINVSNISGSDRKKLGLR